MINIYTANNLFICKNMVRNCPTSWDIDKKIWGHAHFKMYNWYPLKERYGSDKTCVQRNLGYGHAGLYWIHHWQTTARHALSSKLTRHTHSNTVFQWTIRRRHHGAQGEGHQPPQLQHKQKSSTAHGTRALGPSKPLREKSQTRWIRVWEKC